MSPRCPRLPERSNGPITARFKPWRAIRSCATRLTSSIRRSDFAYRVGGDEFALILVEATDVEARAVIERVSEGSAEADPVVQASFGVAVFEQQGSADDLFRRADEAMYAAKRSGGNVAVAA